MYFRMQEVTSSGQMFDTAVSLPEDNEFQQMEIMGRLVTVTVHRSILHLNCHLGFFLFSHMEFVSDLGYSKKQEHFIH